MVYHQYELNGFYLMIMAFSTEKLSVGRAKMFQLLIFTGSPRVLTTVKSAEQGRLILLHPWSHSVTWFWEKEVNAELCFLKVYHQFFVEWVELV